MSDQLKAAFEGDEGAEIVNRQALKQLTCKGRYYIVSTSVNGEFYLRTTIMNPFTTIGHLTDLLNEIKEFAHHFQLLIP